MAADAVSSSSMGQEGSRMRQSHLAGIVLSLTVVLLTQSVGQAQPTPGPIGRGPDRGPVPNEQLVQMEGTWDAVIVDHDGVETKGTVTYKWEVDRKCLVGNFEGTAFGREFQAKSIDCYDSLSRRWLNLWIDSISRRPRLLECTYDPRKKTTQADDHIGMTRETKDKDTIVVTIWGPTGSGFGSFTTKTTLKRKR
jgi:hypothetical protein